MAIAGGHDPSNGLADMDAGDLHSRPERPAPSLDALLASCPLFSALEASDRAWLIGQSSKRRFTRNQIVFLQGDSAEWLLVVVSGLLKVCIHSVHGDELILDTVGPGQAVGEIGVLASGRRSATLQSLGKSECLIVPRVAILDLLERKPAVARSMLLALAAHVHRATGTAADLVFLDLPRRVAKWLLDNSPKEGGQVATVLTQQEMASALGASRQRVNASLSELERLGWIERGPKGCKVLDREALVAFLRQ